jgi:hypothetical protein
VVTEHPLQRQIADALRLELAPPGKVSRDGVVWWSGHCRRCSHVFVVERAAQDRLEGARVS